MDANSNLVQGTNIAEDKAALMNKLQSYSFAAFDMQLYLDTHPYDKKAFEMFKSLVEKCREIAAQYEKRFGPLTAFASANFELYRWLEGPWPWEKEANK
ncbi:MAG: spore coat protein CotJB [Clostridia bacterium]|nr:spore coat protein CotJB [Clostridia bacterium]